ncbi:MAG: C39 family peptidase [Anaerolineae bacterium]|nr:C39 family peptidase [Anaerolineae bacterium]
MPSNYRFVSDVTIPDQTRIEAGSGFTKTWRVENTGDEAWGTGYRLSHVDGQAMTANTTLDIPACQPGGEVDISVHLTAPREPGAYFSDWRFRQPDGEFFGKKLYTKIIVIPAKPPIRGISNAIYIADVTIKDDEVMAPGASFTKTWRVKNTGTLAWGPSYTLNLDKGTPMSTISSIPLPACAPGAECEISVTLTTPTQPGKHYNNWILKDSKGKPFGVILWFRIVISGDAAPDDQDDTREIKPAPPIQIDVPHFSQRYKNWRNMRLGHPGSPVTIGSWGCLLTCFSMTAQVFGHRVTPNELNNLMQRHDGFFNGYFTRWDALSRVFSDITFGSKEDQHPTIVTRIDASLANRIPVPVLVDRTPRTRYNDNDQHWVLVVARNGDNDYWIYDPIDLDPEPVSLMEKYGRADDVLRSAVLSAIFYH